MSADVLEAALRAHHAGLCVLPPKEDGSRAPDTNEWKTRQKLRTTEAEVRAFYANGREGLGFITGRVSGDLEVLDFDEREVFDRFVERARHVGLWETVERIAAGYSEETPRGVHLPYRCREIAGNSKLARRPTRLEERKDEHDKIKTLIETRGEGGFIIVAPSRGRVHETGKPYQMLRGSVETIASVTPEEREALHELARTFDEMLRRELADSTKIKRPNGSVELRPGDDFNARAPWSEVIDPHGWTTIFERGGEIYVRRPGKSTGISATVNYCGSDRMYVFSTSTPLEAERTYDKFGAYAVLNHGGDLTAAARALGKLGYGKQTAPDDQPAQTDDGRTQIVLSGRQIDDVVDNAIAALVAANASPELYMRSGAPVRVLPDEEGRPTIRDAGADSVLERLYAAAAWWRHPRKGDIIAAEPPRRLAVAVRERLAAESDRLPPLRGVVQSPIMRPDGSILTTPGYDALTRLVFAPPNDLRMPAIPHTPTSTDLELATALVDEMLADFPFVTEADRACAWALLFSIVLREVIAGHVPLFAISAPSQGTGKGLLVDALLYIATGRPAAVSAMPDGRSAGDELRKRITAILAEGRAVVVFDNLTRPIDSPALAAVLTAERWTDRVLGSTRELELPNRTIWAATGNNVTVGGDFARRTVWCRLDAKVARPWLRDGAWKHPELLAWVAEHRGELLAAVLTLARGWVVAGRPGPRDDVPILGGYGHWRHVIGGVLGAAGVTGLLGQADEMYDEADEETPAWAAFLAAWRARWGERAISVAELVRVLRADAESTAAPSDLLQALPPELDIALAIQRPGVRVGHALRRQACKRFAIEDEKTVWIERAGDDRHAKTVQWMVRCG